MAGPVNPNKLVCFGVMWMVVVGGAPLANAAVTCSQVTSSVAPCLGYLTSGAPLSTSCCNGAKSLNSAAKTTADRQQACKCLKQLNSSVKGINYGLAAGLPSKCGITIPFKISPSTDCTRVK